MCIFTTDTGSECQYWEEEEEEEIKLKTRESDSFLVCIRNLSLIYDLIVKNAFKNVIICKGTCRHNQTENDAMMAN